MQNYKLLSIIFSILVITFISQSYAYLTVKYDITNTNTNETKTFTYYVDLGYLNNPKTYENDYANITLWLENNSNYYLHWNLTAKINLSYTAELFNASGEHPGWVGSNPYTCNNLPTGWYDSQSWSSIKSGEIGPEHNPPKKAPIPLSALIITLIAIPLLTLKMVRK